MLFKNNWKLIYGIEIELSSNRGIVCVISGSLILWLKNQLLLASKSIAIRIFVTNFMARQTPKTMNRNKTYEKQKLLSKRVPIPRLRHSSGASSVSLALAVCYHTDGQPIDQ